MKRRSYLVILTFIFVLGFFFLNSVNSSGEEINIVEGVPEVSSNGGGGGNVPITRIELKDDNSFSMEPGIKKFEFNGADYVIQLKSVKMGVSEFVITSSKDLETKYLLDDDEDRAIIIEINENKGIDLDKDGKDDIFIELNDISGNTDSIGLASFSIKKSEKELTDVAENSDSLEPVDSSTKDKDK